MFGIGAKKERVKIAFELKVISVEGVPTKNLLNRLSVHWKRNKETKGESKPEICNAASNVVSWNEIFNVTCSMHQDPKSRKLDEKKLSFVLNEATPEKKSALSKGKLNLADYAYNAHNSAPIQVPLSKKDKKFVLNVQLGARWLKIGQNLLVRVETEADKAKGENIQIAGESYYLQPSTATATAGDLSEDSGDDMVDFEEEEKKSPHPEVKEDGKRPSRSISVKNMFGFGSNADKKENDEKRKSLRAPLDPPHQQPAASSVSASSSGTINPSGSGPVSKEGSRVSKVASPRAKTDNNAQPVSISPQNDVDDKEKDRKEKRKSRSLLGFMKSDEEKKADKEADERKAEEKKLKKERSSRAVGLDELKRLEDQLQAQKRDTEAAQRMREEAHRSQEELRLLVDKLKDSHLQELDTLQTTSRVEQTRLESARAQLADENIRLQTKIQELQQQASARAMALPDSDIAADPAQRMHELNQHVNELNRKEALLLAECDSKARDALAAENRAHELETRASATEGKLHELEARIKEQDARIHDQHARNKDASSAKQSLQLLLDERQKELDAARSLVTESQQELLVIRNAVSAQRLQVANKDASSAQLVTDLQKADGENLERAQQLKELQAQLAAARSDLENEKEAHAKDDKKLKRKADKRKESLKLAKEQTEKLTRERDDKELQLVTQRSQASADAVKSSEQIATLRIEVTERQILAAENVKAAQDASVRAQKLEAELKSLKEAPAAALPTSPQVEILEKKLVDKEKRLQEVTRQTKSLQEDLKDLKKAQAAAASSTLSTRTIDLSDPSESAAAAKQTVATLQKQLAESKLERERLDARVKNLDDENSRLKVAAAAFAATGAGSGGSSKTSLPHDVKEEFDRLHVEMDAMQKALDEAKTKRSDTRHKNKELENELDEMRRKLEKAQTNLQHAQTQAEKAQAQVPVFSQAQAAAPANGKDSDYASMVAELKDRLNKKQKECDELQKKVAVAVIANSPSGSGRSAPSSETAAQLQTANGKLAASQEQLQKMYTYLAGAGGVIVLLLLMVIYF